MAEKNEATRTASDYLEYKDFEIKADTGVPSLIEMGIGMATDVIRAGNHLRTARNTLWMGQF